MRAEELNRLHKAQPFRPFRIHLADGRHLDVVHPEFLAYTPMTLLVLAAGTVVPRRPQAARA